MIAQELQEVLPELVKDGEVKSVNYNGLTVLEDTIEIKSIENRLLIFDASVPHHSTTCTDDKCRVNVNFNFF